MFINFNEVAVYESIGINYFGFQDSPEFISIQNTEFKAIHNKWIGESGADYVCQLVSLGSKLTGDKKRLRIAVFESSAKMETVCLFPISMIEAAIDCLYTMAGVNRYEIQG